MEYKISYTKDAKTGMDKYNILVQEVNSLVMKAIQKFEGKDINIDCTLLKDKNLKKFSINCYRIKKGNIRIFFTIFFEEKEIIVFSITSRENTYKKK